MVIVGQNMLKVYLLKMIHSASGKKKSMKHFGSYSTPFLFKQPEEVAHIACFWKHTVAILPLCESNTVMNQLLSSCSHSTLCGNTHTDTHDACVLPYLEEQGSIHGRHVVIADEDDLIR